MPASPSLVLALDQGSHASRAVVFDAAGQMIASHQIGVAVQHRGELEVEQDPEELVASIAGCIEAVGRALGGRAADVRAAGLATQRASIVCWDRTDGKPLSPVISWQDRRAQRFIDALVVHAATVAERTGLRLSPHYGASKLRWCLEHLPAVRSAQREARLCFGPLASFLVHRLLREHPCVVDPANAARTLLWNAGTGEWDEWLMALFALPREALPAVAPTVDTFGHLDVAGRPVPLRCLTGDQSAALFAFGEPQPDALYCNIGTGAFVQALLPQNARPPAGLLRSVVFDDGRDRRYVVEGTVNGAAAAIDWAIDTLGLRDRRDAVLNALKETDEPPLFLNGIGGLGAPFWLAGFRSRFIGEGGAMRKLTAVAESVVFLITVIVGRMREVIAAPARLIVTGGLAAIDPLCQRLADVAEMVVERPAVHEATARGVAYLAAARPPNWGADMDSTRFTPRANAALHARYARWRQKMEEAVRTGH